MKFNVFHLKLNAIESIFIFAILGVSLFIFIPLFYPSSSNSTQPILTITSISMEESSSTSSATLPLIDQSVPRIFYSLTINLNIKFNSPVNKPAFLNFCEFGPKLFNSPHNAWTLLSLVFHCPIAFSERYYGSYNFSIPALITPKGNSYSNISYPIDFGMSVSSTDFNTTSQLYNFSIGDQKYQSITLTNALLVNKTSENSTYWSVINATFYLISDHEINITYGCSDPFNLLLVEGNSWNLTRNECNTLSTYLLPSGRLKYTITSQLIDPTGRNYNYTTSIPPSLSLQVILGSNVLIINVLVLKS